MTTQTTENFSVIAGQAYYCSFITPDSYKGGPKTYKGRVLLKEEDAVDLMSYCDSLVDSQMAEVKKENPKKRQINVHQMYSFLDDFPGMVAFTFKQAAEVPTRDGGIWEPKVAIYDAKAKRDTNIKSIPNGATIKVAWSPRPWFQSGNNMCGVKMQPTSVQVVDINTELAGGTEGNPFSEVTGQGVYETQAYQEAAQGEDLFSEEGETEQSGSDF